MALHHGQGPQPCFAGYLKRYIFSDPYPSYGPNEFTLHVPSGLKPAGSSDPILILPPEVPMEPDQAMGGHELLQVGERHRLLVPGIQMHGQSNLSGPPLCRYTDRFTTTKKKSWAG